MNEQARWLRIKDLFAQALQQSADTRDSWLKRQCGDDEALHREVRALLDAQSGGDQDILDRGAVGALRRMGRSAARDSVGERIGAYRLLRLVGEGGMGSVYLAEREDGDFQQRAALKLVRAESLSDEARARFVRERGILATLTHPHIAQLHDGGMAADGRPYFTLEYVEGETITHFCDGHRIDIRGRVRLMLQVCAAVAYAHRNLIVHRDLKPSNILVTTDGEVKLLDFGIAKLLDAQGAAGQTATQSRMMTPEYAAPEQVLGETITTATDVYAIGVLLYELLSGRLPYARADAGSISWSKAVVEETPEPLYRAPNRTTTRRASSDGAAVAAARATQLPNLRRTLRGDLDRILQRALAKPAEARYATVGALAADLSAYLDGHAISDGTRLYQMRKFAARHWLPLSAAATILAIVLASGAAIVWQAQQIAHEAQNTLQVKDFLFSLFTAVDPRESQGREISAHELLDRGAARIAQNTNLDAVQKAEIEATLGRIYYRLELFDQADRLQESAMKGLLGDPEQASLLLRTQAERAETLIKLPNVEAAATLAADARRKIEASPDASAADRAHVVHVQEIVALNRGDFEQAGKYAEEEIALARPLVNSDPGLLFRALMSSGQASWATSHFDESAAHYREALAVAQQATPRDELRVADAQYNLAGILKIKLRYAEAKQLQQQALAVDEKVLGAGNRHTLLVRRDLALMDYYLGNYAQAQAQLEQLIAERQAQNVPNDEGALAALQDNLGSLLVESGHADVAEPLFVELLSHVRQTLGDRILVRMAHSHLASAYIAQGKLDRAQAELDQLVDRDGGDHGAGNITDRLHLGDVQRLKGNAKAAADTHAAALASSRQAHGEDHPNTASAHHHLSQSLRDAGDEDGAIRELRAALASYSGYLPNGEHPLAATVRYDLALLLLKHEATRVEALQLLSEAAVIREKFLGADDPLTRQVRERLQQSPDIARR